MQSFAPRYEPVFDPASLRLGELGPVLGAEVYTYHYRYQRYCY